MLVFAALFCAAIMVFGIWGSLMPEKLVAFMSRCKSREGLWSAAALRVMFGCVLVLAAPLTRWPTAFEVIGLIAVVAGLTLAFMGLDRFTRLVNWFTGRPPRLVRALMLVVALFGLALLWGTLPGLMEATPTGVTL